jgi:hypothetical protein
VRLRDLIEQVKTADPKFEEFWEGRIALFFGRDLEGRCLTESGRKEVHAGEEDSVRGEQSRKGKGKVHFWTDHP